MCATCPPAEGISYLDSPESVVVQLKLQVAEPEPAEATGVEPVVLTAKKPKDDAAE